MALAQLISRRPALRTRCDDRVTDRAQHGPELVRVRSDEGPRAVVDEAAAAARPFRDDGSTAVVRGGAMFFVVELLEGEETRVELGHALAREADAFDVGIARSIGRRLRLLGGRVA